MRYRLLVVDGDARSLRVLDVSLRNAGFEVETAADGTEAWAKLDAALPDLVIADTELQGIDGFELCTRLRHSPGGRQVPFIFLAADPAVDKKIRGLQAGADDYLVKPAYIKEVLSRVGAILQRRQRDRLLSGEASSAASARGAGEGSSALPSDTFAGELADITVVDLLQLVEGQRRSGIIHLRKDANTPGSIYFRQGKVVDAEVGQLSGVDALLRLFAWTSGAFEFEWRNIRRKDVIERPPAALVIEGMKNLDERNQLRGAFADQTAVFAVDYPLLAERLAEIPDEMNAVLRLCDGVRTVGQLIEDCALPEVEAWNALMRLRDEGIVFDVGGGQIRSTEQSSRSGVVLSADSGPVHRSFAASLDAAAGAAGHGDNGDGVQVWETGREVPGAVSARRRTAPGLGEGTMVLPLVGLSPGAGAPEDAAGIPEPRVEQGAGKIIAFSPPPAPPGDLPVSAPGDVLSDSSGEGTRQDAAAAAAGDGLLVPAGGISSPDQGAPLSPAPRTPGTMSRTQRGFGPRLASGSYAVDSAIPVEVSERRSSPAESGGLGSGSSAPGTVVSRGSDHRSGRVSGSGRTSAGARGDATERIAYKDDEINDRDALDELSLPSRWRGVRFLAAALVVGVMGAMIASRFRVAADARDLPARAPAQADADAVGTTGAANPLANPLDAGVGAGVATAAPGTGASAPRLADADHAPVAQAVATTTDAADASQRDESAEGVPAPGPAGPSLGGSPAAVVPSASAVSGAVSPPADPQPARPQSGGGPVVVQVTPVAAPAASQRDASKQLSECRTAFVRDRFREAVTACSAAVAANPRSAEALTMLAHAELNRGRLTRAGELAEKALALDPGIADAYVIIGGVHQDSGQNSEAKAAYRRYLQLAPRGRYADELRSIVNGL